MLRYTGMPTAVARACQAGAPDANGQVPERRVSQDGGEPCRHCLGLVKAGEAYLVLAYRPFPAPQPYAEIGPVFLHAQACEPPDGRFPDRERSGDGRILRGYGNDDRIVYGTGTVVSNATIEATARQLLGRSDVAYLHMRSATNNCFTLRIDRAP